MSTKELKNRIVTKLDTVDDDMLLRDIYEQLEINTSSRVAEDVPDYVKKALERSIQDFEAGRVKTDVEVVAYFEKWFSERK